MSATAVNPATAWIVGPDTGVSSKTIWSVMMGVDPKRADVPYDSDDFGRCYRLLQQVPEWRGRLQEVAARYPEWTGIVREWDMLEARYRDISLPDVLRRDRWQWFHDAIQPLIDVGRLEAGWVRTGPGSWRKPARRCWCGGSDGEHEAAAHAEEGVW